MTLREAMKTLALASRAALVHACSKHEIPAYVADPIREHIAKVDGVLQFIESELAEDAKLVPVPADSGKSEGSD